jgi:hypothetical protein
MAFDWRPECGSLLHVVPLAGGKVRFAGLGVLLPPAASLAPPSVHAMRAPPPAPSCPPALPLQVRSYRAPAFLATHWVNAWESADGRYLHLDAVITPTPALMSHWQLDTGACGWRAQIGLGWGEREAVQLPAACSAPARPSTHRAFPPLHSLPTHPCSAGGARGQGD